MFASSIRCNDLNVHELTCFIRKVIQLIYRCRLVLVIMNYQHLVLDDLRAVLTPATYAEVYQLYQAISNNAPEGIEAAGHHCECLATIEQWRAFLDFVRPFILGQLGTLFTPQQRADIAAMPPYVQLEVLIVARCFAGNMFNHGNGNGGWGYNGPPSNSF